MTSYQRERDDLRREVRQSTATTLYFWPKVNGRNVAVAGTPTYTVNNPDGTEISSGSVTVAASDDGQYSRLAVPVPAISTLAEDYTVRLTFSVTGEPAAIVDVIQFDCVLWPFGDPSVSLNDLIEERVDIEEILARHAVRFQLFDPSTATRDAAGIYAIRARVELDARLRDQVAQDARSAPRLTSTDSQAPSRYIRPHLILDRVRLNRVERKLALMLIYASDMGGAESEDESASLHNYYRQEAEAAFRSIGPLKYAQPDSLLPTSELTEIGRVVHLKRVQS